MLFSSFDQFLTSYSSIGGCVLVLMFIGIQDLIKREVTHEELYVIILYLGFFTNLATYPEKLFCLLGIPVLLFIAAYLMARIKHTDEISIIGGADLKTIAVCGWAFGPYIMAFSIFLSVICSIPFIFFSNLGVNLKQGILEQQNSETTTRKPDTDARYLITNATQKDRLEQNREEEMKGIPFCFTLFIGVILTFSFIMAIALM